MAAITATIVLLSGCGKPNEQAASVALPSQPQKAPYSMEDWKRDYASSFEISDVKTEGNGVTSYYACFEPKETKPKCRAFLVGMKDGFRKVDHLTPVMTSMSEMAVKYEKPSAKAFVSSRVVTPHCREAAVVLNPKLFAKSWLFMDRIALMADGEVVFEKSAESQDVKRDVDDDGVEEAWAFRVDPEDLAKLAKFSSANVKIVRVSGEKGYVTLSKDSVFVLSKDIDSVILATKAINDALSAGGGPNCS